MAMFYCLISSFGPQKTKFEIKYRYMHYKNINLKMPSFLWQGNLPNRASKIKCLLAHHDIHLPRASGQVLSYTSDIIIKQATEQLHDATCKKPMTSNISYLLDGPHVCPRVVMFNFYQGQADFQLVLCGFSKFSKKLNTLAKIYTYSFSSG